MHRYKLTLEYDGTCFCGFQRQKDLPTVQLTLEKAVRSLTFETVTIEGAGRTDTGVHALGQVVHFDLPKLWDPYRLREGLNFYLQDTGVYLTDVEEVSFSFHARFSALLRTYEYVILNRPTPSVFAPKRAWYVRVPLDVGAMQEGASQFIGHHDFSAFRSINCQATSPFRTLSFFRIFSEGHKIYARIQSRSFLHNQVRIMVGTLKKIGEGRRAPSHVSALLATGDKTQAGPTAPPYGLYLVNISYKNS